MTTTRSSLSTWSGCASYFSIQSRPNVSRQLLIYQRCSCAHTSVARTGRRSVEAQTHSSFTQQLSDKAPCERKLSAEPKHHITQLRRRRENGFYNNYLRISPNNVNGTTCCRCEDHQERNGQGTNTTGQRCKVKGSSPAWDSASMVAEDSSRAYGNAREHSFLWTDNGWSHRNFGVAVKMKRSTSTIMSLVYLLQTKATRDAPWSAKGS